MYEHRFVDARKVSVLGVQDERETSTAKVNECLSTNESTLGAAGKGLDGLPTTSVVGRNTWEDCGQVVISSDSAAVQPVC